ncbi:MAG: hypothetical protein ACOCP4_01710 [Candidatus Woesearchaeota archaeon]
MKISDINESVGLIIQDVNTTQDVSVNEIQIQAKKFGNQVDKKGKPRYTMSQLETLGLTKYKQLFNEAVYDGNIGAMEVFRFFNEAKKKGIMLHEYVSTLSKSENQEDVRLGWRIIQQFLGVQLKNMPGDE